MFQTHLKFFIRVFLKDKFFSVLNILGLALGIAVSIMLLLILQHDFTYDKHFANHENIYRLGAHEQATGVDFRVARSARELGAILKEEFPEVLAFTRINDWGHTLVTYEKNGEEVAYYEDNVFHSDSTYFTVFKHDFIAGDEKTCLNLLNSAVITESTAQRYFGKTDPLDKTLLMDGQAWKVTGVIKDLPDNTHMKFDFILSGLAKSRQWVQEAGQIKDLGFSNDNVLVIPIQDTLVQNNLTAIRNELTQYPKITSAATSYSVLGMGVGGPVMWAEGENGEMKQQQFSLMAVDENYFKTMDIAITKGRAFEPGPNTDVDNIFMVNEAAAKLMGWGDDPVGKKIRWFHGEKDGQVIGVVRDFNYRSLHNPIEPLIIIKSREAGGFLHLKIAAGNLPETMDYIRTRWATYDPNHPFEYFFLDQRFNEQYRADETQYKLLSNLSYICIFISLLGLLGLSAFTAAQRTKEIGIRKVHGASIPRIIYMLYKDVMYLVLMAAVLVIPASFYMISKWMGNFAYQTNLNYLTFGVVTALALIFAFFTVVFHSLKTARTNPVESLKYE